MADQTETYAGVDVGTECVKVVVLSSDGVIRGRSVVPAKGYFQDRVREAMAAALDEAQIQQTDLGGLCATGFAMDCVSDATLTAGETSCHALGAFHYIEQPLCVVDIGGREPTVIHVDGEGRPVEIHSLRRCAVGLGTFLMFAARHLDVHPTQLHELAARVDTTAAIGSYCSVFAGSDILDRLREGASREAIARGCMRSIAERIVEIGSFKDSIRVTGGVAEYFPGVLQTLAEITGLSVDLVPEPIQVGALGAALHAQRAADVAVATSPGSEKGVTR